MPYLTMREKSKATTKPWFISSYDIQPGNGVGLFWDTHIYSLSLDPHGESKVKVTW